ncbi:MAG: sugar phosphate isomerase/epimerase family protein [Armatimonadota bacterium]
MAMRENMTRRAFLRSAAVGGAMASLASAKVPAQEAEEEPAFRFGMSTCMYHNSPLEVAIEEIAKTGCEAVDVWEERAATRVNHMAWVEQNGPDKLRELVEDAGLKLWAFSIYRTAGDKRLERLEWLKEAGGEVAVLGGGARRGQPVQAGIDALAPLVERAEELGLKIAGENHGGTSLNTIASMREFVSLAKSPALGMALAPYHVMGAGEPVPEAVQAVGEKLFFFYAWQRAPGMRELPGDNTLDFLPVLRALRQVNYPGYVNIFTHASAPKEEMTQAVIASREYLEGLARRL